MSYLNEQLMAMARGDQPAQLVLKHATYLNVFTGEFLEGDIAIADGVVIGLGSYQGVQEVDCTGKTVVPGFIDSHMHLESTMVMPARFAEAAIPHGTTAVVTDPHEITNVCGRAGFDYIWKATKGLPLDVFLMVPSCVPASPFDESGCVFDHDDVTSALQLPRVLGLAELMGFPGTVGGRPGDRRQGEHHPGPGRHCGRPCPRPHRQSPERLCRRPGLQRPRVQPPGGGAGKAAPGPVGAGAGRHRLQGYGGPAPPV